MNLNSWKLSTSIHESQYGRSNQRKSENAGNKLDAIRGRKEFSWLV